jgi:hypothetical protein
MAARPFLIGILALAAVATGLRTASGPRTTGAPLDDSSETHSTPQVRTHITSQSEPIVSISDEMTKDPEAAGRQTAETELRSRICRFVVCPELSSPVMSHENRQGGISPKTVNHENGSAGTSELAPWLTSPAGAADGSSPMYPQSPEIILSTAPDPIHTHGALLFDRSVDAIEDALQDSGWEYQGSWLPWSAGSGKSEGNVETKEEERAFNAGREGYPGVILFRPSSFRRQRPLIVLVVGDSATTGVVASQFRQALEIFLKLSDSTATLRIMGPDYTGAGPSLHALLRDATEANGTPLLGHRSVSIASGTVSDSIGEHIVAGANVLDGNGRAGASTRFVSFGVDSGWELPETWSFLVDHGQLQTNEIAELSEDESGFGELLSNTNVKDRILHLKFPRGISHLRSAYEKNAIWGFGGSSGANSVSLNLDFAEPREADDSVPTFAQQQLPVSQEASMGQVASTLEDRQIKAVLVSASDVLDELFVAQFLSRQAPNVMVVLRGTDVLFLRSGDRSVARNTYVVGPWPLIPANAEWTRASGGPPLLRSFASGDAEGVYTATRYLVQGETDSLQDYRSPSIAAHSTKAGSASPSPERPPLWFSMVGRGAYWPVALLDDPAAQRSPINLPLLPQKPSEQLASLASPPLSQRLMLLIAFALSLLHTGKCLRLPFLQRVAPWYDTDEDSTRVPKLVLQLCISVLGIIMTFLVYEPASTLTPISHIFSDPAGLSLFLITIAFLALTVVKIIGLLWKPDQVAHGWPKTWRHWSVVTALTIGLVACLVLAWFGMWNWLRGPIASGNDMALFFSLRSSHPLSGASPVFPLFLALNAVTLIFLSRLSLLNFSSSMRPRVPGEVPCSLHCPSPNAAAEISKLLVWPLDGTSIFAKLKSIQVKLVTFAMIVLSVAIIAFAMHLSPKMFDDRRIQLPIAAALFFVVVAQLWDLIMGAVVWRRLKAGCLIPLESSPLRSGFTSISGLTWKSLWLMPQNASVQYRALTRSLEQAMRKVMDGVANISCDGQSLREAIQAMWDFFCKGHQKEATEEFGKVQDRMACVGQALLLYLQQQWADEVDLVTAPDRLDKPTPGNGGQSPTDLLRKIAEEWVALIYIHYTRLVLVQIRTRLATAAMLYVLLVWAITSYPFMNRHALTIGLSALLGILALVTISTYASINQDPILSRTINVQPGKLDIDFFWKTASMVGVPFLGLVASQFPEVSRFLFSWIEPGLTGVR